MATADDVIVEFEARVGGYERDLKRAQRTFQQTTGAQEARMASFERRMGAGARRIGAALAGIATIATAREFLRLVDAGKSIEAQLRLATRETGGFAQATDDVRRIAMQTRSGLEETARLYSVFARDSVALGISQTEAARATETLTKSFVISGATAAETSGATRQLIQGLQSGTLRGDEFNSVMEQAPRLQKLFAAALGVSKGELRSMAEEGKITAAALVDALTNEKFTKGIDAEFRELPVTFGQAMQQVENAAIITFGAFDRGGGFSQMLANFITDGTRGFADLEQSAVETGIDIRSTFEGLANAFDPLVDAARAAFGDIGGEAMTLADRIRPLLGQIDAFTRFAGTSFKPGLTGSGLNTSITGSITQNGTNLLGDFNEGQARSEAQRRAALFDQEIKDLFQGYDVLGNRIGGSGPSGGGTTGGGKPTKRRGPSAESLAAKAERDRLAAIREEGSKQEDLLRLQDDIIAARSALATAAEDVARYEMQQLGIEQAARLSRLNTEKRLGELTQDEYDTRATALAEEIELRRELVRRRLTETQAEELAEAQVEALRQQNDQIALEADALLARADIADTLEKRRFLENSALALQQEIERSLLEQAIAEGKVADAAAARAALADRQSAEMTGLGRRNQGAFGQYLDRTSDPKTLAEEAAVREMEALRDGLAEGLAENLGTKNQFVKDLFSIFLDQVIFRPLADALKDAQVGEAIGGFISSIFGRDIGGPTRAGQPYLIGKGQYTELFVPQQAGVIVPNHRLTAPQSGGTAPVVIQVDARGAVMNDQFASMILRQAKAWDAETGARSYQQSMKDAPGAVQRSQRYGK